MPADIECSMVHKIQKYILWELYVYIRAYIYYVLYRVYA